MERYQSIMEVINQRLKNHSDYNVAEARRIKEDCMNHVNYGATHAVYHMEEKRYWTEKLIWERLFPDDEFPGNAPRKIAPEEPESTAAYKEKREDDMPDIEIQSIQPEPETSTTSTLAQTPMLLQMNGEPEFSTEPLTIFACYSYLDTHNQFPDVRVGRINVGSDVSLFVEPLSPDDKDNAQVLQQCIRCWWFLECYRDEIENSQPFISAEAFLNSPGWKLKEKLGKKFESNQTKVAELKAATSHKLSQSQPLDYHTEDLEERMNEATLEISTSSSDKRKELNPDEDMSQSPEEAESNREKRRKLGESEESNDLMELWNLPPYSILTDQSPRLVENMLNRRAVAEKHFGVQFQCATHRGKLLLYCKPDLGASYHTGITLCKPAFIFLKEFWDKNNDGGVCIDEYLEFKSSNRRKQHTERSDS